MRPATEEERQLDMLDFANRMVCFAVVAESAVVSTAAADSAAWPASRMSQGCAMWCLRVILTVVGCPQHQASRRLGAPPPPGMPHPAQVFGNAAFRSQQRQIIEAALSGRDCFVLMPTGGERVLV